MSDRHIPIRANGSVAPSNDTRPARAADVSRTALMSVLTSAHLIARIFRRSLAELGEDELKLQAICLTRSTRRFCCLIRNKQPKGPGLILDKPSECPRSIRFLAPISSHHNVPIRTKSLPGYAGDEVRPPFRESAMISVVKCIAAWMVIAWSLMACTGLSMAPRTPDTVEAKELRNDVIMPDIGSKSCNPLRPEETIDVYKVEVAQHILRTNLGNTFDGRLPPMLPAIVVLRISVDSTGTVTDVSVQRSRNEGASKIAMASIYRSGQFPLPCSLIDDRNPILTFSETFLFNDQYQFQLRSLAGPQ